MYPPLKSSDQGLLLLAKIQLVADDIHGLYGWDEHVALAQKSLKTIYRENHFALTIGVALKMRNYLSSQGNLGIA